MNANGATKVWRGAEARALKQRFPDRIIRSRWHEKWKDQGDDYDNGLNGEFPEVRKCEDAKSRWILIGFEDPDVAELNRSVPTPATEDVPMSCQLLASLMAMAFTADVSSAFGQTIKGQRKEAGGKRLFATPPKEGIPGEDPNEEILIEILAEIYGLVSGPPGWRQTLLTQFKSLNFKRHPLAPCVVLMYETINGVKDSLSGLIVIETDDLLGGGIGPLFQDAMDKLRKKFNFG